LQPVEATSVEADPVPLAPIEPESLMLGLPMPPELVPLAPMDEPEPALPAVLLPMPELPMAELPP
jgi:hypothetical protein